MPYLRVQGAGLYYSRVGTGGTMLWLPGFAISSKAWEPVLPHYASDYDCISFDNRASGRSGPSRRVISIPSLAGDAVGGLDALGIESAHVYGISYGGMVALEMAIRFPERVPRLGLGGTSPGGPRAAVPSPGQLMRLGKRMRSTGSGRFGLSAALFSEQFLREQPDRARELTVNLQRHRAPFSGVAGHLMASVYHDTVSRLRLIQAPTLVVHGGADRMTPLRNARLLAGRIPDAGGAVIEGTGHASLLEKPEESARVVLDFLDRRRPEAGRRRRNPTEPLTRAWGLPVGAMRTAHSLALRSWWPNRHRSSA